jgi:glutamyl-Q tRNA(Asp) synthetase
MPEEARRNAAPGSPGLGDLKERGPSRPALQALQPLHPDLQPEIVGRPDVEPLQPEQEIDLRRPAADALEAHQLGYGRLVLHAMQAAEVEIAALDRRGDAAAIEDLLAAEADRPQLLFGECKEPLGRERARGQEPPPDRARRGRRDLLGHDRADQGREAPWPAARRRVADQRPGLLDVRIAAGQLGQREEAGIGAPIARARRLAYMLDAAMDTAVTVTRFAPSPTGWLHLGHAHSALFAWSEAKRQAGRFLLRIEDIDRARSRPEFEAAIFDDLAWLGLGWERPVRRQSEHFADYAAALARLEGGGLLYPCFCTRAEIAAAGQAPHGLEHGAYPGTCRPLTAQDRRERIADGRAYALRLDAGEAARRTGPLSFTDRAHGRIAVDPSLLGDVVLARKDTPASYHLAVTLDDALQGVTLVTRGEDLLPATHVHRLLQALLDLPEPAYHHHPLLIDETGKRLSKRHGALAIRALREAGLTPAETRARAGLAGLPL